MGEYAAMAHEANRIAFFESRDPEETRHFVSGIFCAHRFVTAKDATFGVRIFHVPVGRLSFNSFAYSTDVFVEPGVLDDFYLLQLVLRGAEDLRSGVERFDLRPGTISVIGPDAAVSKTSPAGTEKLIVRIDRRFLEMLCMQHLGHDLGEPLRFRVMMPPECRLGGSLRHTIAFLHGQLTAPASVFGSPLMVSNLEHALATALLVSQPSNYFDELNSPAPAISPAFVRRAEEFIEARADEPIGIVDVVKHAGVSTRSLFAGFRKYRNTTPMAHLQFVRMRKARAEMLAPERSGTKVIDVAVRWGFGHLGRFASEYRRLFGESPSETLRRSSH